MKMYRYDITRWSETRISLALHEFDVVKETNCGVWIDYYGARKFVKLGSLRSFARPTKEEAFASFQRRRQKYVAILEHRLREAKASLQLNPNNESVYCGLELDV